ncbi:MAG: choice-of-anchor D domain-containing protein, partial [Steroidobacteraceae bacterium]
MTINGIRHVVHATLLASLAAFGCVGCGGSGGGGSPGLSFSVSNLTFASQTAGTTSTAQPVVVTNTGNAALSISTLATTGNFAETNNCPASLAAGASCTVQLTFAPTATGTLTGSLAVTDNASGSPQSASLTGTGAAVPKPGIGFSPSSLNFASPAAGTASVAQPVV